jgi:hypothetical protein
VILPNSSAVTTYFKMPSPGDESPLPNGQNLEGGRGDFKAE